MPAAKQRPPINQRPAVSIVAHMRAGQLMAGARVTSRFSAESSAFVDAAHISGLACDLPAASAKRRKIVRAQVLNCRRVSTWLTVAGLLAVGGPTLAQQLPADLDAVSGARLPYLTRAQLGEEGQRLADIFARNGQATDPVSGPLAFAAYNVPVANALLDLHDGAVGEGTLDAYTRELAILVACRETNYALEWNAHEPAAINAGVDAKVIDVVRHGGSLAGVSDPEAAVIRFGRELFTNRRMSSETFANAVEHFGQHGAMDLVAVMSTYAVSGFYAIAVNEHPGGAAPLEPLEQ
jgi:4-carboxymuconolactone decarboxylase